MGLAEEELGIKAASRRQSSHLLCCLLVLLTGEQGFSNSSEHKAVAYGSCNSVASRLPSWRFYVGNLLWGSGNCIFTRFTIGDSDAGCPWTPPFEKYCFRDCKRQESLGLITPSP